MTITGHRVYDEGSTSGEYSTTWELVLIRPPDKEIDKEACQAVRDNK